MKRTPLKRVSDKKRKQKEEESKEYFLMQKFFLDLWREPPHPKVCYETGEKLGWAPRTYHFHHVLEKEKYPQYRFEEWNIVFVTLQVHDQVHRNIDKTPKIKALREELLKKIENG